MATKRRFPVIAVTGSSGAGTSTVREAFSHIFYREGMRALYVEGDSFHRHTRSEMKRQTRQAKERGRNLSHFSPEANLIDEMVDLFKGYRETGAGRLRHYLHNEEEAAEWNQKAGTFTPWQEVPKDTDLMLYEGLHGGLPEVVRYVDLLVGVVPIINLEWIQKIQRDSSERGYETERVVDAIKRRMDDYVEHITPQFSRTDINFQRIPTVDTSNPFIAREVPTADESLVVIRIKKRMIKRYDIDLVHLKDMIDHSFISRRNTLVIPGPKMPFAMEVILAPVVEDLVRRSRKGKSLPGGKRKVE